MTRERIDCGALFVLLLLCTAYTFPRWADWNQNSRFDLVVAIVDHGTLSIDCCVENTGDYAVYEGHAYSDKAPGLSLLAVPAYAVLGRLLALPVFASVIDRLSQGEAMKDTLRVGGTGLQLGKIRFFLGLVVATLLLVSIPSAVAGVLMYLFLARVTPRTDVRLGVVLAWILGTNAFAYAGSFYAHQLVAAMLFASFYLATRDPGRWSRAELALVGVLLGLAVISEYPAVLIAAPIAGLMWLRLDRRVEFAAVAGAALLPIGVSCLYHLAIYGTPLPVGYRYSALWQERHSTGVISLTYPHPEALWGILFGRFRGLLPLSPVLLFGFAGFVSLWRSRRWRLESSLSAWAVLSFIAFASSSSMWWGGFAVGPRYLVPMLPFLAWPAAAILAEASPATRIAFATTLLVSIALVWGTTFAGQQFPDEAARLPWSEYVWPRLTRGDLARNAGMILGLHGWASLLPLAVAVASLGAVWRWLRVAR